ncbi:MAG: lipoate--protein ligase family protein [Gemmatimonadaceae bacterium]
MTPLGQDAAARLGAFGWRFIDSGPSDGASNMAVDLALLDHARAAGEATLRVYAWSRPTLSFGRHERARGRFDAARLAAAGIDVVRRPTGGRALLHHHEVTYSVAAPVAGLSLRESYGAINALLLGALRRLGVNAMSAERRAAPVRPLGAPCFAEPNEGELVVGGAKLVGSAQWRDGDVLLQHGSILLADDQSRIAGFMNPAERDPVESIRKPAVAASLQVATLETALGRPVDYSEVSEALAFSLRDLCADTRVTSSTVAESDSGISASVDRHRDHFRDPSWTWRC